MAGIAAAQPAAPRRFTLRPRVIRTLLWLRWQLLVRGYARSTSRIVGAVLLFIFLVPLAGFLAFGLVAGFQSLLPDQLDLAQNLLFYVLLVMYVIYAVLPLLQYSINEGLDITKLTIYPLSQPELMASLLFSTLLDIPTLAVILVFVGIGLGWAHDLPSALGISAALVLAYIHLVGISQLLLSALMGVLRTRRYRDLALVLITLLGLSCSLGFQAISRLVPAQSSANGVLALLHYNIGAWLQFLPPGMVGRAVVAFATNQYAAGGLWLAELAGSAFLLLWAWSAILTRSLASPEEGGSVPRRRRARARAVAVTRHAPSATSPAASAAPLIPAPVLALAAKDLRYYWRDPQYKRAFLGSLYLVGILILNFFTLGRHSEGSGISQFLVTAALFLVLNLTSFGFGYEGPALTTLALFPVRAAYLLIGRNLATFAVGLAELALLLTLQGFLTQNWYQTAVLALTGTGALIAAMGPGNVIAVLFPMRVARQRVGGAQNDSGSGCASSLLIGSAYSVALLLTVPVAALIVVPQFVGRPDLTLALAPLALVYGIGIYAGGTALAAAQYYPRLTKIIEVVTRE
jgi:ABC-2 type transport system permease protein